MSADSQRRVVVDETHCGGRHVTGLERITLDLFSAEALAPLRVIPMRAKGRRSMMLKQTLALPAEALRDRSAIVLCPGFPPSPLLTLIGGDRVVPYIHDLFLITRPQDLNRRAKLYMVAPFRLTVARARLFLVNSQATADALRQFCRPEAEILLYRPAVRNVFGVSDVGRGAREGRTDSLRLIAIGTVEPRKNLPIAAALLSELRRTSHPAATLDIVGRPGWGVDMAALAAVPGVTLHGFQSAEAVQSLLDAADALVCTSHDEGLGLPLLEAQYAGVPVIAPDQAVFREVLGESGIVVSLADVPRAAGKIATTLSGAHWRAGQARLASRNLERWNTTAAQDRLDVIRRLQQLG